MFEELWLSMTSRSCPGARQAGLVYEVAGIAGRHRRHREAWAPHLEATKTIISEQISDVDPEKPILLLGAGLGLDLPVETLNAHKGGAQLCDAVETPKMRKIIKENDNLSFKLRDLTGLMAPFWTDKGCDSITPPSCAPLPMSGYGLAISCNLLSQLPLSFANSPPVGDTEIRLTAAIQQAHVRALRAMDCPALLITDYERHDTAAGDTNVIPSVAPQLLPGDPIKTWDWRIAPKGELAKDRKVTLKVGAWLFEKS